MTIKRKTNKLEFLEDVWYYTLDVLTFIVMFIFAGVLAFVVVFGPIFLAFGPMIYASPWWGLVSIPGTILLIGTILAWRNRK